ncbi:MAG TPA: hypothetical protein VIU46_00870 [Gallionellaceae bacterium]
MEPFFRLYLACWLLACIVALALYLRRPAAFIISGRRYWHFLAEPWKLLTFAAGGLLITLAAPYTGDPTWDYVDGAFMSILCFATAPWVVGVLYLRARGKTGWVETYIALCAWLFSASWSYDIYLVWRDGIYSATWLPNLFASSLIYLCAGLFWNLEWQPGRGVIFSFMQDSWPARPEVSSPWRLLLYAAIFAIPAVSAVLVFVI